jgi:hypothetical protein
MKKIIVVFLFLVATLSAQESITKPGGGTGTGDVTLQQMLDTLASREITINSRAGFPTYYVSADSMSYYKPIYGIPFDSSMITTDTLVFPAFPFAVVIDSIEIVNQGVAANFTYWVGFNDTTRTLTTIDNSGKSTTSIRVADRIIAANLDNTSIPAGNFICVWFSSITTKPKETLITIYYHLQ